MLNLDQNLLRAVARFDASGRAMPHHSDPGYKRAKRRFFVGFRWPQRWPGIAERCVDIRSASLLPPD